MLNLIVIFSFILVFSAVNLIYLMVTANSRQAKVQLAQIKHSNAVELESAATSSAGIGQKNFRILGGLASVFSRIIGPKFMSKLGSNLTNAGIALRPEEFILLDTVTALRI